MLIDILKREKIVLDFGNGRIVTENDKKNIMYLSTISDCPEEVLQNVVNIHNTTKQLFPLGSQGEIDKYLLDEPLCSQEAREEIGEALGYYYEHIEGDNIKR